MSGAGNVYSSDAGIVYSRKRDSLNAAVALWSHQPGIPMHAPDTASLVVDIARRFEAYLAEPQGSRTPSSAPSARAFDEEGREI